MLLGTQCLENIMKIILIHQTCVVESYADVIMCLESLHVSVHVWVHRDGPLLTSE